MYRFILILLAVAVGVLLLYRLERVVVVLILAMFFAYLIAPLVDLAERPLRAARTPSSVSRGMAVGIVYLVIAGVAWAGAAILLPPVSRQVSEAASRTPDYVQSL